MRGGLVVVALAAVTGMAPAHAESQQPVPRFNVRETCATQTKTQADAVECVTLEQSAYNELLPLWDRLSVSLKAICINTAVEASPYVYYTLRDCTKGALQETSKASALPAFKY